MAGFTVTVKTLDSHVYSVNLRKGERVEGKGVEEVLVGDLKQLLYEQHGGGEEGGGGGVPEPHLQKLIFHGKVLKDELPLAHYQVRDGHVVHMVQKLRPSGGGGGRSSSAGAGTAPAGGGHGGGGAGGGIRFETRPVGGGSGLGGGAGQPIVLGSIDIGGGGAGGGAGGIGGAGEEATRAATQLVQNLLGGLFRGGAPGGVGGPVTATASVNVMGPGGAAGGTTSSSGGQAGGSGGGGGGRGNGLPDSMASYEPLFGPYLVNREPLQVRGQTMFNARVAMIDNNIAECQRLLDGGMEARSGASRRGGQSPPRPDRPAASAPATEVTDGANVRQIGNMLVRLAAQQRSVAREMDRIGRILSNPEDLESRMTDEQRRVLQGEIHYLAEVMHYYVTACRNVVPGVVGTSVWEPSPTANEPASPRPGATREGNGDDASRRGPVGIRSVVQQTMQQYTIPGGSAGAGSVPAQLAGAVDNAARDAMFDTLAEGQGPQVQLEIHSVPVQINADGGFEVENNPYVQAIMNNMNSHQQQQQGQPRPPPSTPGQQMAGSGGSGSAISPGGQRNTPSAGTGMAGATNNRQSSNTTSPNPNIASMLSGMSGGLENMVQTVVGSLFGGGTSPAPNTAAATGGGRAQGRANDAVDEGDEEFEEEQENLGRVFSDAMRMIVGGLGNGSRVTVDQLMGQLNIGQEDGEEETTTLISDLVVRSSAYLTVPDLVALVSGGDISHLTRGLSILEEWVYTGLDNIDEDVRENTPREFQRVFAREVYSYLYVGRQSDLPVRRTVSLRRTLKRLVRHYAHAIVRMAEDYHNMGERASVTSAAFPERMRALVRQFLAYYVELLRRSLVDNMEAAREYCNLAFNWAIEDNLGEAMASFCFRDIFTDLLLPIHQRYFGEEYELHPFSEVDRFIEYRDGSNPARGSRTSSARSGSARQRPVASVEANSNGPSTRPSTLSGTMSNAAANDRGDGSSSDEVDDLDLLVDLDEDRNRGQNESSSSWQEGIPEGERKFWKQTIARDEKKQSKIARKHREGSAPIQRPFSDAYRNGNMGGGCDSPSSSSSSRKPPHDKGTGKEQRRDSDASTRSKRQKLENGEERDTSSSSEIETAHKANAKGKVKNGQEEQQASGSSFSAWGRAGNPALGGDVIHRVRNFVPNALSEARRATGVVSGNDDESGAGTSNGETRDEALEQAFHDQLRRDIRDRLSSDRDYDAQRFPEADGYFNMKKD
eukprot:Nk52_evm78s230 gene=Nk52_evmTU78s230